MGRAPSGLPPSDPIPPHLAPSQPATTPIAPSPAGALAPVAPIAAAPPNLPAGAADLERDLARARYLPDPAVTLSLWLALRLDRPLLVEGPAGVGKTDLARAAAEALGRPLIRMQCYEGLDESKALYEWDYAKQMLYTQLLRDVVGREVSGAASLAEAADWIARSDAAFFSERFLLARPLLAALRSPAPAVLLVDEVDRSDPEFEAFLLELLSDFQLSIPELGTVTAVHRPLVVLTSNRAREMSDALRRRCLHAHLSYPGPVRELAIVRLRVPGIDEALANNLVAFVQKVRQLELNKAPSIAETVDFARALLLLGARSLDPALTQQLLGVFVKNTDDRAKVERHTRELLDPIERR